MTSPILVTGGTGTLGRLVVPLLRDAGRPVRVLSRHADPSTDRFKGDLLTGEGIESAVDGAEVVVHLAGGQKGDDVATANLVRAASKARVKHIVCISVIGADRLPLAWLQSKLAAERAVAESGTPWSTLRAAQFHGLVFTMIQKMAKLPIVAVPGGLRLQPVDPRDVAARIAELALGAPSGLVPDIAGPTVYTASELIRSYLRATGKRRALLPVRLPGKVGRAYRAGDNLRLSGATLGTRTWEEFLAESAAATDLD
ncbi:SDR family oxidoreductase [Allorhizocola rhizosphaerae]|uniref:SDR family oxidoreductase n=1 Tax=Allorhizocola rhizosphaerae TaxID=1872709 RepID=UPI000E3EB744|nr:NAD(P)H-binding protein [Allorhizocola rhizosphaerae]